jgi:hypothetical protein
MESIGSSKEHCIILYSWDRASLDMEILYMTNKMQLIMIFIITNALHVSGVYRPSSGAHELYVQLQINLPVPKAAYTVHELLMMGDKRPKHVERY